MLEGSLAREGESPIADSEAEIAIEGALELGVWSGAVVEGVFLLHFLRKQPALPNQIPNFRELESSDFDQWPIGFQRFMILNPNSLEDVRIDERTKLEKSKL